MALKEVTKCRNCESTSEDKPVYFWRKVTLYKHETTKATEGIEIYCGLCHKTITVLPCDYPHFCEDDLGHE